MFYRCRAEISLDAIRSNYHYIRSLLPERTGVMAVVKADAYGHGSVEVAATLQNEGCKKFAVATKDEAVVLRESGITGDILVLGYTPPEDFPTLEKYDISQTAVDISHAAELALYGETIKRHLALNTGMNRSGIACYDPSECAKTIRKLNEKMPITGLYTHFCAADDKKEKAFTALQAERFKKTVDLLSGVGKFEKHCANTAAVLGGITFGDYVRVGIGLYGISPVESDEHQNDLRPALELTSSIVRIDKVLKGESVGYGRRFFAPCDMLVATIPAGYADGVDIRLAMKGFVAVRGKKAPIIGSVCMDLMTVDVTRIEGVSVGDRVVLIGEGVSASFIAGLVGTIPYDILCRIGKRVPRVYS